MGVLGPLYFDILIKFSEIMKIMFDFKGEDPRSGGRKLGGWEAEVGSKYNSGKGANTAATVTPNCQRAMLCRW